MQSPRNAPGGRGVHSDKTVEARAGDPNMDSKGKWFTSASPRTTLDARNRTTALVRSRQRPIRFWLKLPT
jgi:hypothetical protein